VYFIDAAFMAIGDLYQNTAPDERRNLRSLIELTTGVLAQHVAEYVVASKESEAKAQEAVCNAVPSVSALMQTPAWQASYRKEEQYAERYNVAAAALTGEQKSDLLKHMAWSIRIDALILSHISSLLGSD
jgi:hypothetical protein